MLEKDSVSRKLLCFWGWHRWLRHEELTEDRDYRVIIPFFLLLICGLILSVDIAFSNHENAMGTGGLIFHSIAIIGSLIFFPKAATLRRGAFNGTCIFCHRHVSYLTDERSKRADDKQYEDVLSEAAKDAYNARDSEA